jgi:hypothetical protein
MRRQCTAASRRDSRSRRRQRTAGGTAAGAAVGTGTAGGAATVGSTAAGTAAGTAGGTTVGAAAGAGTTGGAAAVAVAGVAAAGTAIVGVAGLTLTRSMNIAGSGNAFGVSTTLGVASAGNAWISQPIPSVPPASDLDGEDQRPRQPLPRINLDSSAVIAASQVKDPWLSAAVNAHLANMQPVITRAALGEYMSGSVRSAGPVEGMRALILLMRTHVVADNPSARVSALPTSKSAFKKASPVDRIVLGTGDEMGIPTMTGDREAVQWMDRKGVWLNVVLHNPAQYLGM